MANKTWIGLAPLIAQVSEMLPVTIDIGDALTVTIGTKSITHVAITAVEADATAALLVLALASVYPEFTEVTWTQDGSKLVGTANTAGYPFTATPSIVAGGSGAFGLSVSTANSSPNDWRVAANWAEGVVPAPGDTVIVDNSGVSILYGIDFSASGGYYGTIKFGENWSGDVGLPESNSNGYDEYRSTFMDFNATNTTTLEYRGSGSRSKFKFGASGIPASVTLYGTGTSPDTLPSICLTGDIRQLRVYRGNVGVAVLPGQSSNIGASSGDIFTGFVTSPTSDATLKLGGYGTCTIGSTCTTNFTAGTIEIISTNWPSLVTILSNATVTQRAGTGAVIINYGGKLTWPSSQTITSYTGGPDSQFVRGNGKTAMTMTACTLDKGATLDDQLGTIVFTNPILLRACKIADVTLDLGTNRTLQVA